jgi:hypothetical protein
MTENIATFLFRIVTISESHYAVNLFQSCQNLLLYHTIHFLLILTTKQQSHGKENMFPQYTTVILG